MNYTYTEIFCVDIKHADVAYKVFDMWKALGIDPELNIDSRRVSVAHTRVCVTIDKDGEE